HADNAALKQSLDSKKSLEEKLRQQVKALQTELIDTKTAFEECKDKCSSIDESHSALTEEHEAFKRTIEESTHENTILMNKYRDEVEDFRQRLRIAKEEGEKSRKMLLSQNRKVSSLEHENTSVKQKWRDAEETVSRLELELSQSTAEIDRLHKEITSIRSTLEEKTTDMTKNTEEMSKTRKQQVHLETTLREQQEHIRKLHHIVDRHRTERISEQRRFEERSVHLEGENERLKHELAEFRDQVEKKDRTTEREVNLLFQKKEEELSKSKAEYESKISSLSTELKRLTSAQRTAVSQKEEYEKKLKSSREISEKETREMRGTIDVLEEKLRHLRKEGEEKEEEDRSVKAKLERMRRDSEQIHFTSLRHIISSFDTLKANCDSLHGDQETFEMSLQTCQTGVFDMQEALDSLRREEKEREEGMKRVISATCEENMQLKRTLTKLGGTIQVLQRKVEEKEEIIGQLNAHVSSLTAAKQRSEYEHSQQLDRVKREMGELVEVEKREKERMTKQFKEVSKQHAALQISHSRSKEDMKKVLKEQTTLSQSAAGRISSAQQQLSKVKLELEQSQERESHLRQTLEELTAEKNKMYLQMTTKEEEESLMRNKVKDLESRVVEMKKKKAEMSDMHNKQITTMKATLIKFQDRLKDCQTFITTLTEQKSKLKEEVDSLHKRVTGQFQNEFDSMGATSMDSIGMGMPGSRGPRGADASLGLGGFGGLGGLGGDMYGSNASTFGVMPFSASMSSTHSTPAFDLPPFPPSTGFSKK
ncbi:hypothetical protein ADUPG1_008090, partial [Aduncisulcus paluster]